MSPPLPIAFFITPHGFGHAGRASALMLALQEQCPRCRFELFTTVPEAFFVQSGIRHLRHHCLACDTGLVQRSPLEEDLAATADRLDRFMPFDPGLVRETAGRLTSLDCRAVVCDIAALGIVAAKRAGLPSVLVENFTWDWIYQGYADSEPRLKAHQEYLAAVYPLATHHIRTKPCRPSGRCDLTTGPMAREPRTAADQIRRELGIAGTDVMILVSMGGVADPFSFVKRLPADLDAFIVIPGADTLAVSHKKIIPLPRHSAFYHPDLIAAADVLIGKAGYSTVAEACRCGIPFGYLNRERWPEAAVLEAFIADHLPCRPISAGDYAAGAWVETAMELATHPKVRPAVGNGAVEAAGYLLDRVS
jgi:hypothetical protein